MDVQKNRVDESLIRDLNSDDEELVTKALSRIRENGNEYYIEPLFEALFDSENSSVKREIRKVLADVKSSASVDVLLRMIDNPKCEPMLAEILTTCWESGLDFTKQIDKFIALVIERDFVVAFEALSVIENMEFALDADQTEKLLAPVLLAMESAATDRKSLLDSVVAHIRSLSNNDLEIV